MFLGHFRLDFAGKRFAPRLSLSTLSLGVQFADLLYWILTLLGIEHFRVQPGATRVTPMDFYDYPISDSLLVSLPGDCSSAARIGFYGETLSRR